MTMILKKDFTSFNHRLFVVPVSVRAISFKSSPSGELSYYKKKEPEGSRMLDAAAQKNEERQAIRRTAISFTGMNAGGGSDV